MRFTFVKGFIGAYVAPKLMRYQSILFRKWSRSLPQLPAVIIRSASSAQLHPILDVQFLEIFSFGHAEHRDNEILFNDRHQKARGKLMPRSAPTHVSITLQMVVMLEKAEYRLEVSAQRMNRKAITATLPLAPSAIVVTTISLRGDVVIIRRFIGTSCSVATNSLQQ